MKPNKPSKFRRVILVNWLDLPYAQIDLDDHVTIFEGGNGSGKSTLLLAALVTLMPDKKQLRSRKVTIEKHAEEAIYHRLQHDEPIAYAALEIQLADGIILAGVHITKQKESNSISLDVFTVRRWQDRENVQDFFRFTEGDKEWTCNLNELKQRAGEWGMEFHAHPTLIAYFRELYDSGVIPLAMATDLERSQYAHLLETSMAGGMSSALVDRLKNYLLPEYEKLPDASRLMHDNLRSCIETQNELKSSNEQYTRIATLFHDLNSYVTALGTRINRRTLNAWDRRHSKVATGSPSKTLAEAQVTVDELTRLRLPAGSRMILQNGEIVDCDRLMAIFGEIAIPERAWENIKQIETPNSRVLLSVENKGAFVDFPSVPYATLLFLPGDNTGAMQLVTSHMGSQTLIHFGDLDPDGIQIYEGMVSRRFAVRHFVPGYVDEYLITHAQPCKTPWPQRDYSSLHPVISTLASRSLWLEHEALVLDHRFEAELESLIRC